MTKNIRLLLLGFYIFCFAVTRIPRLENDIINPDAVNWHYRSQQFFVALKSHQWANTYQHYHPGVTLMWVAGTAIELTKQITGITVYDHLNFSLFDFNVKFTLIWVQLILSIIALHALAKVVGFPKAFLTLFIFSFEPFILGNSRLFHMDLLFTLFTFISLLYFYLYYSEKKRHWLVFALFFAAMTFLTRSIGLGVFLFGFSSLVLLMFKDIKKLYKDFALSLFVFVFSTFAFFPALWTKPISTLTDIFSEGERIGIRKGHPQIVFGEETISAGWTFYPLVILIKSSPFLVLGIFSYIAFIFYAKKSGILKEQVSYLKKTGIGLVSFLLVFYLGYFLVLNFPTKKIDRYMIALYPFLALLVSMAIYKWYYATNYKKPLVSGIVVFYLAFSVYGIYKFFPYNFTYTSINPATADKIIAQKSFGVGIYKVKEYIMKEYGEVRLGFYDVKPIEAIYPNSKVFDVREIGPSKYDLLILSLHEDFNNKTGVNFVKKESIYINGLEYWRIYEKAK